MGIITHSDPFVRSTLQCYIFQSYEMIQEKEREVNKATNS